MPTTIKAIFKISEIVELLDPDDTLLTVVEDCVFGDVEVEAEVDVTAFSVFIDIASSILVEVFELEVVVLEVSVFELVDPDEFAFELVDAEVFVTDVIVLEFVDN